MSFFAQISADVSALLALANNFVATNQPLINNLAAEVTQVSNDVTDIHDQLEPILAKMNTIENLIFGLLITMCVVLVIWFVYWCYRHLWPIMRGWHVHVHDADAI